MILKEVMCVAVLLISSLDIHAQYENVWAFGKYAGVDFNPVSPMGIESAFEGFGEASASICDEQGQLLFYTEGSKVWNRNNIAMPNGDNLTSIPAGSSYGSATSSSCQGALIVPFPDSDTKYYIFSLTSMENRQNAGRLYYSIVDITLNSGLGDVVPGSKGVLFDSLLTERMTAVIGDDEVWLLTCSQSPNAHIKAYRITSGGITTPIEHLIGEQIRDYGCMIVSPDRTKLAITQCNNSLGGTNGLLLFNFDYSTGQVSNKQQLSPSNGAYGVAFSINSSKLYITSRASGPAIDVLQFDLDKNSTVEIRNSATFLGNSAPSHLKLAADGKIYFIGSSQTLGALNYPNLSGPLAQYTAFEVLLYYNSSAHFGLPNVVPVATHQTIRDTLCFTSEYIIQAPVDAYGIKWDDGSNGGQRTIDSSGIYWVAYHTSPAVYHVDTFQLFLPSTTSTLPEVKVRMGCKGYSNGYAWFRSDTTDTTTYHYEWYNDLGILLSDSDSLFNISDGDYSVHITTAYCDTIIEFMASDEALTANFQCDTLICLSDTLQVLNTTATNQSTVDFFWSLGDGTISNERDIEHQYKKAGTFEVILAAKGIACVDTMRKFIQVDAPVSPFSFSIHPDRLCAGESIYIATPHDSTISSLNWKFGDGTAMSYDRVESDIQHAYKDTGSMSIHLHAQFRACPDTSFTDSITVYPFPKVDLGGDSSICLHGAPVYLKNVHEAPLNPHHYLWSTGDTTASLKVVHPGVYTLSVTTEPIGCTTTESIAITKDCYIDVPNAFTPNGDGHNDYFFPRQLLSESISRFRMQVFNRWGQVVFETTNLDGRGWDGRFNDKTQPMGVYVYRIEVGFTNGREEQYEGNVTLVR